MRHEERERLKAALNALRHSYKERMFDSEYQDARLIVEAAIEREGYGLIRIEDADKLSIDVL